MSLNQTNQKDQNENYWVQPHVVMIFSGELWFYFASRRTEKIKTATFSGKFCTHSTTNFAISKPLCYFSGFFLQLSKTKKHCPACKQIELTAYVWRKLNPKEPVDIIQHIILVLVVAKICYRLHSYYSIPILCNTRAIPAVIFFVKQPGPGLPDYMWILFF